MSVNDDSLTAQYIRAIENPDSIGFRNKKWYAPNHSKYDNNNRGFGMDISYNKATADLVKNRPGKYLTEEEERELRLQHIDESKKILDKYIPPMILREYPSKEKEAMAIGMLYRGDGIGSIIKNPTIKEAYISGTAKDMQRAIDNYYKSKKLSERAQRHNQFFSPNRSSTKKNNVPISIRRPVPYTPPSYKTEQFVHGKKYDEGGYLNNDWNSLSMKDKAEMIKVAISNGITSLPEIRQAYNEFAKGGYIPSDSIKKSIANWEGSSMKTNRSFEEEARDFNRTIPVSIRNNLSSNQLDALFSYGYNVGMGKLRERVLPTLTAYTQGKASKEDVQKSMWATKDSQLRGLTKRRNWEREMFGGNYRTTFGNDNVGSHIDPTRFQLSQNFFDDTNAMINTEIPQIPMPGSISIDPSTLYKAPTIDDTLFANPKAAIEENNYNPQQEKIDNLQRFNTIMGMLGESTPFSGLFGSSNNGLLSYINAIYNS